MLLHGYGKAHAITAPIIGKLTSTPVLRLEERTDYIVYARDYNASSFAEDYAGYAGAFMPDGVVDQGILRLPCIYGAKKLEYLADGDVLLLHPSGTASVLYRKSLLSG